MKKAINIALKTLILTIILAMLISSPILANGSADGIEVSPNVINLDSKGGSFSIHTNIPFSIVQDVSLIADGTIIPISATFADDRGDLVVFIRQDFKGENPIATCQVVWAINFAGGKNPLVLEEDPFESIAYSESEVN
ncbi:hypothetical protein ACFLYB_04750 [Chloroflexota bacterium]